MIEIFRDIEQFKIFRSNLDEKIKRSGQTHTIGLVPTMGNLHRGHLSLVQRSLDSHETTIVTIYVNPKQFSPNEDFEKYPRTLKLDIAQLRPLLEKTNKSLVIFAPATNSDIYPIDFETQIGVGRLADKLCGAKRTGHFDGVCTVVHRLFIITRPHSAYFGQKDYQQFLIIKRMVQDLEMAINIFLCPTQRDKLGLAYSSRNQFIKKDEINDALDLANTIKNLKEILENSPWSQVKKEVNSLVESKLKDKSWDYLEVLDSMNLKAPDADTQIMVIAGAKYLSATRLIDNKLVEVPC